MAPTDDLDERIRSAVKKIAKYLRELMNIKQLLILSAVTILGLMLFLLGINRYYQADIDHRIDDQERLIDAMAAFKDARYHVVQIQQFLTDVGATADPGGYEEAEANLAAANERFELLLRLEPGIRDEVTELRRRTERLHKVGVEMAEAYVSSGRDAGNLIMKRPGTGLDDASIAVAEEMERVVGKIDSDLTASRQLTQEVIHHAEMIIMVIGLGIVAVIALILAFLYRRVVPPLRMLQQSMDDISHGARDLTVTLEVQGDCEIGRFARSFNQFVDNIRTLVQQVASTTMRLAKGGDEMSQVSDHTLHGMERLLNSSREVVSSVREMSVQVRDVARNAKRASESAGQSDQEARRGQQIVFATVDSINELATRVTAAGEAIRRLETDVGEIGSILDVIRGIAEQTNLLALNAAIEAARAGEQGRGFAVVADEVRSLAARTQTSTREIQEKIERLQSGTTEAVSVMEEGRRQTEQSVRQAADAGDALENITQAVATISEMNEQIARAANSQTTVADTISRHIADINREGEQTTENAHATEAASGEMGRLLGELTSVVNQFRIGHNANLDLSQAKAAHLAWKSRLRSFLDDQQSLDEKQAVSHKHCDFGKWYYSTGINEYGSIAELQQVEQPHKELHELIREIIQKKKAGQLGDAESLYQRIEELSSEIVNLLTEVERSAARMEAKR
jgi:methyl-accepting chemotaxis protein